MSDQKSFEERIKELEAKIDNLESGGLTLEEALKNYEDAMTMLKALRLMLDKAQQKVQVLSETSEGFELAPFDAEEGNHESE